MGNEEYPEEIAIRGYKPASGVHAGQIKRQCQCLRVQKTCYSCRRWCENCRGRRSSYRICREDEYSGYYNNNGKGAMSSNHRLYVGNIGMYGNYASNMAVSECDVLLAIGVRFSDRITGTIEDFAKMQRLSMLI